MRAVKGIGFQDVLVRGFPLPRYPGLRMVPTDSMRRELEARGFRNVNVVARGVDTQRIATCQLGRGGGRFSGAARRTPGA
jgi:hypothetical protein